MSEKYLVEPDLEFIENIVRLGGDSVKKCFQCATCSVVCPIAPGQSPFPRKEMLATSWGLKDKVLKSGDIWLCHECGDCTVFCPRGAKPGDVLSAARSLAIEEYSPCKSMSKLVNDPAKLPIVFLIPAVWFAILAYITVFLRDTMDNLFKSFGIGFLDWTHGVSPDTVLAHTNFVSTWLVDLTFVPLSIIVVLVFLKSLNTFIQDIHKNAVLEGKTNLSSVGLFELIPVILTKVIPDVLLHKKFKECGANASRANAHMLVLFGFIACAITTGIVFLLLYFFHTPGPHLQISIQKILGNVGGIFIVLGSFLMIQNRMSKDAKASYKDWYLIGLVFGLGATGLLTELARMSGAVSLTYFTYYLHLILVFNLFAFLPFSKIAHLVYRTFAIAYFEAAGRK